jgi:hypothetical protein
MTDGVCFQYNYMSYIGFAEDSTTWKEWMTGGLDTSGLPSQIPFASLYNSSYGNGKHWMAEAIKGSTTTSYNVLWNTSRDTGATYDAATNYLSKPGLGATIYSIGFGLDVDGEYNSRVGKKVVENIASNSDTYYDADDKQDLRQAFSSIGRSVRKAATNAYIKDQMGKYFDLRWAT